MPGSLCPYINKVSFIHDKLDNLHSFYMCVIFPSAVMPPDNSSDFDIHLERSLRELDNLQDDMSHDVFMVYCNADIPHIGEEGKCVAPRRIYDDLTNNGLRM